MSAAFRQHYTPPAPEQRRRDRTPALIGLAACAVIMIGATVAGILHVGMPVASVKASPVPLQQAVALPLDPLPDAQRLADMRVDSFRAGYRAALEGGCKPPVLIYPLQSRQ